MDCTAGAQASAHAHAVPVATVHGKLGRTKDAVWEDSWAIPSAERRWEPGRDRENERESVLT